MSEALPAHRRVRVQPWPSLAPRLGAALTARLGTMSNTDEVTPLGLVREWQDRGIDLDTVLNATKLFLEELPYDEAAAKIMTWLAGAQPAPEAAAPSPLAPRTSEQIAADLETDAR